MNKNMEIKKTNIIYMIIFILFISLIGCLAISSYHANWYAGEFFLWEKNRFSLNFMFLVFSATSMIIFSFYLITNKTR